MTTAQHRSRRFWERFMRLFDRTGWIAEILLMVMMVLAFTADDYDKATAIGVALLVFMEIKK